MLTWTVHLQARLLSSCDHEHANCERCDLFPSLLQEILAVLREEPQSGEIEELSYQVNQAVQDIEVWKAHLLRCINQDLARVDVLNKLTASFVLLVLDWAMKYLPCKFRESQADWYGKRGIPCHLTVAITKSCQGKIQMLTFAHMFKSATQDSIAVLAVVDDELKRLKSLVPQSTEIYLRADNPGCYHAATTLLGLKQPPTKHVINLVQFDFSDPQGGKGSCDRKAASLKNKMKVYLNSGDNIKTPEQMKQGIESSGGTPGERATCCGPQAMSSLPGIKLKGISFLNNFKYTEQGMRVWKAYSIGEGQLIKWGELSLPLNNLLKEIKTKVSSTENPENSFLTISASRHKIMIVILKAMLSREKLHVYFCTPKIAALSHTRRILDYRTTLIAENMCTPWNKKPFWAKLRFNLGLSKAQPTTP